LIWDQAAGSDALNEVLPDLWVGYNAETGKSELCPAGLLDFLQGSIRKKLLLYSR